MKKITSRFPNLKVLLVEDYFINQEVTKDILELMGCTVDIAEEGNSALEMARKNPYDLILMDLQIPNKDGLEVTRELRKDPGINKKPIIVALTASALDGDKEKCLEAGADDYLSKPMEAEGLEECLRHFFQNQLVVSS